MLLYMDSDGSGVKECLSEKELKEGANDGKWQQLGSRPKREVDCLKISVIPEGGAWSPEKRNYCFYEEGDDAVLWQTENTIGWTALEWGVTGVALAVFPPAALGVKVGMGFIAGAAEEYSSQTITGKFKQQWPGHIP